MGQGTVLQSQMVYVITLQCSNRAIQSMQDVIAITCRPSLHGSSDFATISAISQIEIECDRLDEVFIKKMW